MTSTEIVNLLFTISLMLNALGIFLILKQDSKISQLEMVRQYEKYKLSESLRR